MKQQVIKEVQEYCRVKEIKDTKKIRFHDYSYWISKQHCLYKKKIGRAELYTPATDKDREEYCKGFYAFLESIPAENGKYVFADDNSPCGELMEE